MTLISIVVFIISIIMAILASSYNWPKIVWPFIITIFFTSLGFSLVGIGIWIWEVMP